MVVNTVRVDNFASLFNYMAVGRSSDYITKKCLYNFEPLEPHFYTVKLGFTGYTLFFLFLLKSIDCGYSLEPPRRGGSNDTHNLCFEQKYEKYLSFFI